MLIGKNIATNCDDDKKKTSFIDSSERNPDFFKKKYMRAIYMGYKDEDIGKTAVFPLANFDDKH